MITTVNTLLARRGDRRMNLTVAIGEMHKIVASGVPARECAGAYFQLVSLYRENDHLAGMLEGGQINKETLALVERTFNGYFELLGAAKKGEIKLHPAAVAQAEENFPYAKFYAGVFALLRGETDAAFDHFSGAADQWGIKAEEIATLIVEKPEQAAEKLGNRFALLRSIYRPSANVPVTNPARQAAAAPRPAERPAQPVDTRTAEQRFQDHLRKAQEIVLKNRLGALRELRQATEIDPANKAAQKMLTSVLSQLCGELESAGNDHAERARQAKAILAIVPEEARARSVLTAALVELGRYEEALVMLAEARGKLSAQDNTTELDYQEAICLFKLKRNEEGLARLESIGETNRLYRPSLKMRLFMLFNVGRFDDGLALLKKPETEAGLKNYDYLQFKSRFLWQKGQAVRAEGKLPEAVRLLEEAHDLADRAFKAARNSGRGDLAASISTNLVQAVLKEMMDARGENARAKAAAAPKPVPPAAPPQPTPTERLAQREGALTAREGELAARASGLEQRAAELARLNGQLAERTRELDDKEQRLQAIADELRRTYEPLEQAVPQGKRVVKIETIQVGRRQTIKERGLVEACGLILKGEYDDAAATLAGLKFRSSGNVAIDALEALLEQVTKLKALTQNAETAKLQKEIDKLKEQARKDRQEIARLEGENASQRESLRRAQDTIAALQRSAAVQPEQPAKKSFDDVWREFTGLTDEELTAVNPALSGLMLFEVGTRGAALSGPEIIARRREVLGFIVGRMLAGEKVTSTTIQREEYELFKKVAGKRVLPNGFESAFVWAEALKELLS